MKKLFVVAIFTLLFALVASTASAGWKITQLTDNADTNWNPKINDNGHVVWAGDDGSDLEIFIAQPDNSTTPSCLAEQLFDRNDPKLETVRRFRDEVLYSSVLGTGIIDVYYRQSDDMVEQVKASPLLRRMYKQLFEAIIPVIKIMLDDPNKEPVQKL